MVAPTAADWPDDQPGQAERRGAPALALSVILVVAGLLRCTALTSAPPGLHHDEAVNLWNAWCLLHTGRDAAGQAWPVFYMRAIGENRSTLFVYLLLPFEFLGGLDLWVVRLLPALAGVATVALLYWVGARLFDRWTGLAAAALLAVCPTHIQLSRWAHEASIAPLLTLGVLAAMLRAGVVPRLSPGLEHRQSACACRHGLFACAWAALAGLAAGVACYGYPAVRLFLPPLALAVCVAGSLAGARDSESRGATHARPAAFLLGFALTLAPLLWQHLAAPEQIARRGMMTWLWSPDDPLVTRVGKVLLRYVEHFDPRFLGAAGDGDEMIWTANAGFLSWYVLPPLLLGLVVLTRNAGQSRAAQVALAGVLCYPLGDSFNWHPTLNGLRSAAGLWPLVLGASVGVSAAVRWLDRRRVRAGLVAVLVALGGLIVIDLARFAPRYFHERALDARIYFGTHVDYLEACRRWRAEIDAADAVICTTRDSSLPYLALLIGLEYDPQRWLTEPRAMQAVGDWERCERFGKFYFAHDRAPLDLLRELRANDRAPRLLLLLRPTDETPPGPPLDAIRGPDGRPALLLYEVKKEEDGSGWESNPPSARGLTLQRL